MSNKYLKDKFCGIDGNIDSKGYRKVFVIIKQKFNTT